MVQSSLKVGFEDACDVILLGFAYQSEIHIQQTLSGSVTYIKTQIYDNLRIT